MWSGLKGEGRTYRTQEVVRVLGVPNHVVRELADTGLLPFVQFPSARRRNVQFDADRVDALRKRMEQTIPLTTVAAALGLPYYGAEQLAAMGLLTHDPDPALWHVYGWARVERVSVECLQDRLKRRISSGTPDPHAIPLRDAAKLFGGGEKPWGALIEAFCQEALPCWAVDGRTDVDALRVRIDDLKAIDLPIFERTKFNFGFRDAISQRDAYELLNITPRMWAEFQLADKLGFKQGAKGSYAPFQNVVAFASEVVPRAELALKWGVTVHRIAGDPRLENVARLSFGWKRQELSATCGIAYSS